MNPQKELLWSLRVTNDYLMSISLYGRKEVTPHPVSDGRQRDPQTLGLIGYHRDP